MLQTKLADIVQHIGTSNSLAQTVRDLVRHQESNKERCSTECRSSIKHTYWPAPHILQHPVEQLRIPPHHVSTRWGMLHARRAMNPSPMSQASHLGPVVGGWTQIQRLLASNVAFAAEHGRKLVA